MKIDLIFIISALFIGNISFTMDKPHKASEVFTLESYRKLSPIDKERLNTEFQATFEKPIKNISLGSEDYYILNNPSNIDKLISAARKLNDRYQNSVIVSLGQSPAYIVKAAEILNELENNKHQNEYKYLAFSGQFLSAIEKKYFIPSYEGCLPNESQLNVYNNYLKSHQLDPGSIVSRFNEYQKPTVFVEYTQRGNSLASFIYTLNAIAAKEGINKELLKTSIIFYIFQPLAQVRGITIESISIAVPPYPSAALNTVQTIDNALMVGLANADKFNDRLVSHYSPWEWEKINPQAFIPSNNAKLVVFKIINRLNDKK